jgi:hypothetical protein
LVPPSGSIGMLAGKIQNVRDRKTSDIHHFSRQLNETLNNEGRFQESSLALRNAAYGRTSGSCSGGRENSVRQEPAVVGTISIDNAACPDTEVTRRGAKRFTPAIPRPVHLTLSALEFAAGGKSDRELWGKYWQPDWRVYKPAAQQSV